jgi:hypothetical protein
LDLFELNLNSFFIFNYNDRTARGSNLRSPNQEMVSSLWIKGSERARGATSLGAGSYRSDELIRTETSYVAKDPSAAIDEIDPEEFDPKRRPVQ